MMVAWERVHVDRGNEVVPAGGRSPGRLADQVAAAEQSDPTSVPARYVVPEAQRVRLTQRRAGVEEINERIRCHRPHRTTQHFAGLFEDKAAASSTSEPSTVSVPLEVVSEYEKERSSLRVAPVQAPGDVADRPAQESIAERCVQGPCFESIQPFNPLTLAVQAPPHLEREHTTVAESPQPIRSGG